MVLLFTSRRQQTRSSTVSWARRCVEEAGPVHDVPGPTSTNIFRFPPRRATDAPTRIIASKIHQNRQWWMPSIVITKVETRVSFSITVLLYVSRSQPGQKTHEFHLSMTTKSKCGSGIGWIADTFFEKTSQENR